MNRYKFNKSTLIIAAIVVLLCLVSIAGATFALFTSDLEDGKIGVNVTSGDIEVDIIDDSKNPTSLVGEVLDFEIPDTPGSSEDDEILFEPGALYYTEGFRVKNIGEIPANFIAYISEDEEIEKDFYEAFDVWITNDTTSREGMVKIQKFKGTLKPGETSDVYYLVFRMKASAGNEFQGRTFKGVGITVTAVQGNANYYND